MARHYQRDVMKEANGDGSELQLGKRRYQNKEDENDSLALCLASYSYSNSSAKKPSLESHSFSTHLSPQEIKQPHDHGITIPSSPSPTQMMATPPHDHGILISPPPPTQMTMNAPLPFNLRFPVSQPAFGCNGDANSTTTTTNHNHYSQREQRAQLSCARSREEGTRETVPVLYPWATDQLARVHSLEHLRSKQIETISGLVQCKKCERKYEIGFNLEDKFAEIWNFIARNKSSMHDRAPAVWLNPVYPRCKYCNLENGVRPVMAENNKEINWLFLLLGQMLGLLTLEQLKYFCKHTKNHRTGAKDRVLYLTYLGLCKQLDPNGPFDR
ncbi:hypothetical protein K2173_013515 [Erythroxylum novogranatense]|uniref:DUF7086 domain-containing protein n=1 Tax=Erythroxylum novogranatense TaxID=1862640 RepID=A0AAV8TMH0_9ROSI|nr:hypothetical protein K2173_013515 [Erythroxylum novogranatense]